MAKAKVIKELDCTADAREWAEKVLQIRISEVFARRDKALDFTDIEGVHDMRVSVRRLRSALRDFTPLADKGHLKDVGKELKKLADVLGDVRDQDVAIAALDDLRDEATDETIVSGLRLLSAERQNKRDKGRKLLTTVLNSKEFQKLPKRFKNALEKAFDKRSSKGSPSFNQAGRTAVAAGLEDFLDLSSSLYYPSNDADHHRLRISAKRLRYALELFVACWGDTIAPYAKEISEMQSHLGEIHDCDVWMDDLGNRLEKGQFNASSDPDERSAAAWLLLQFSSKRYAEYSSALRRWIEWERNDLIGRMRSAVGNAVS